MKRRVAKPAHVAAVALPLIIAGAVAIVPAAADMQHGYPAKPLLSTGKTVADETIHYPTSGPAQVTAAVVTIAPGGKTIVHRHGVPLFAYILDGEVTVDYGDRGKHTYRKGDAFMEAMGVPHLGINNGTEPVRILAVYMGAKGAQNVIPDKEQ